MKTHSRVASAQQSQFSALFAPSRAASAQQSQLSALFAPFRAVPAQQSQFSALFLWPGSPALKNLLFELLLLKRCGIGDLSINKQIC
jgi:hypothetical protein